MYVMQAKRYLVRKNPDYHSTLSEASKGKRLKSKSKRFGCAGQQADLI